MCFFSGSVWAKTSATSATLPSEIHILLAARSTSRESVFLARVRRLAASEPVSGSVSAKQPSASPEHSRGSHSCFCSSVPQRSIEPQTSEVWTETTVRADGVGAADLLDDQAVADVVEAAAAVLLGDRRAEVADLAELRGELAVEARRRGRCRGPAG